MHSTILKYTFLYFAFYCLWSFIFTQTVFFPPVSLYLGFFILFILFLLSFIISSKRIKARTEGIIWMPFLFYTILGYLIALDGENIIYRIVCVFLLFLACKRSILDYIPIKFLFWSGIIAAVGIFIQFLLPSFFDSHILPLFTANQDRIKIWIDNGYGFSGFYYQLSHADMNLLLAGALAIFFLLKNSYGKGRGRFMVYLSIALIFSAILLTGKRSFAVMAIIIPLFVYLLGKKQFIGTVFALLIGSLAVYVAVIYFVNHLDLFTDNVFLHRLAETVEEIQYAEDFSSGREGLAESAIRLFEENPVFGVGVGNFVKASRQYTDVHNTYLQVLCEQGIIGLLLMVIPLIVCLLKTISLLRVNINSQYSPYIKYSLFIQIYFLMYSFTGNTMVNYEVYFFYFLAIALLINVETACSRQRINTKNNYELSSSM